MNIFNALSEGKGKLNEENLSAMLGFLLNPKNEHGLGDLFLRRFLRLLNDSNHSYDSICDDDYMIDITLESPYEINQRKRYVDIDIKFFCNKEEKLRILIENKIKANSADESQFLEEYQGVCQNLMEDNQDDTKVIMVFLTPAERSGKLLAEYEALDESILKSNHSKHWIFWHDQDEKGTITNELKQIIIDENMMVINPISEYVRHTIKAFTCFIKQNLETNKSNSKKNIVSDQDLIKESFEVKVTSGEYIVEAYKSTAIKVIDKKDEMYVTAKPILREIIECYKLPVSRFSNSGSEKDTRQLGRDVFKEFNLI